MNADLQVKDIQGRYFLNLYAHKVRVCKLNGYILYT